VGPRRDWTVAVAELLLLGALAPRVGAQEATRAAEIAATQAEKAAQVAPYEPNAVEEFAASLRHAVAESPNGFHLWLDSVYSGGGFTLGGGYRRFYGDRTSWDARGLLSMKGYKRFEIDTTTFARADDRIELRAIGGWRDATQVSFYGVGNDSTVDGRTNFGMQQLYAGVEGHSRGPAALVFDLGFFYEDYLLKRGSGSSPAIDEVHTPATVPGLGASPSFLHLAWTGGIDWRPSPGYARRGGLYTLTYDGYVDVEDDTYTFERVTAEIVQHVPLLRENWVLSLHGVARTTLDDDDTVPYFLLPALGSGSTLRAFPSWRFRDRHSLLVSGEWRWIVNRSGLDMAIFYDAGKVTARRADLTFSDLTSNVGVGVRFHGPRSTPLRIEVAHGREGVNLVFSGGAAF
jgi:hypothetical protein